MMIPDALEQSRLACSLERLVVTGIVCVLLIALGVTVARAGCAEFARVTAALEVQR